VPGLAYEVVVRRFVFSVRNGGFGFRWYGDRQAVTNLLDMHSFANRYAPEPTSYVLRPGVHTVAMAPEVMLARASIWAKWLPKQGWPVPPELATVVVIDVEADEVAAPLMLPAPVVVPEPEPAPTLPDDRNDEAVVAAAMPAPADARPTASSTKPHRRRKSARALNRVQKEIAELGDAYPAAKTRRQWAHEFGTSLATLDRASSGSRQKSSDVVE
jgi:hypothetical protein